MKKTNKKEMEKDLKGANLKAKTIILDDIVTRERVFTNIKKLKCDYTTYKEERTKYNMPVEKVCSKCGKRFEVGEEIYTAFEEGKQESCIICKICANNQEKDLTTKDL